MLITDEFVMLNFPKTGSTYARNTIKKILDQKNNAIKRIIIKLGLAQPPFTELMLPKIDERRYNGVKDQHGTYRQIPKEHRDKRIVSIVRHPCERYVSTYLFKWWEKYPPADIEEIAQKFPNFPDLNFSEYYEMTHLFGRRNRLQEKSFELDIGYLSIQFAQFYYKEPAKIIHKADDGNFRPIGESEEMAKIFFLHQENLNEELKTFLLQIGFTENEVSVIDRSSRINVTLRQDNQNDVFSIIPPEIMEKIRKRDALLFYLFPEYRT